MRLALFVCRTVLLFSSTSEATLRWRHSVAVVYFAVFFDILLAFGTCKTSVFTLHACIHSPEKTTCWCGDPCSFDVVVELLSVGCLAVRVRFRHIFQSFPSLISIGPPWPPRLCFCNGLDITSLPALNSIEAHTTVVAASFWKCALALSLDSWHSGGASHFSSCLVIACASCCVVFQHLLQRVKSAC